MLEWKRIWSPKRDYFEIVGACSDLKNRDVGKHRDLWRLVLLGSKECIIRKRLPRPLLSSACTKVSGSKSRST